MQRRDRRSAGEPVNQEEGERLRAQGLRVTRARTVLMAWLQVHNQHGSAEEILHQLQDNGQRVAPATLYQNLNKLADAGLLRRFPGPGGVQRFDANLSPHHHLVCRSCGRIVDVAISEGSLRDLSLVDQASGETLPSWHLDAVVLEFRGLCPVCSGQAAPS